MKWFGSKTRQIFLFIRGLFIRCHHQSTGAIAELTLYEFVHQQREMDINTQIYGVPISFVEDNSELCKRCVT